jgi:hypothetical protein
MDIDVSVGFCRQGPATISRAKAGEENNTPRKTNPQQTR